MTQYSSRLKNKTWHQTTVRAVMASAMAVTFASVSSNAWSSYWCQALLDQCLYNAGMRRIACGENESNIKATRKAANLEEYQKCAAEKCNGETGSTCAKENCYPAWEEKNNEIERDYQSGMNCCDDQGRSDRDKCYMDYDCTSW